MATSFKLRKSNFNLRILLFTQQFAKSFRQIRNMSNLLILLSSFEASVKMILILWPMRESGHKCDSSWSKWWISRGWGVVYLWSNVSQIESAILSQTVTLDIELREATAKKTAPNQADSLPFKELCTSWAFHMLIFDMNIWEKFFSQMDRKGEEMEEDLGNVKQILECCTQRGSFCARPSRDGI